MKFLLDGLHKMVLLSLRTKSLKQHKAGLHVYFISFLLLFRHMCFFHGFFVCFLVCFSAAVFLLLLHKVGCLRIRRQFTRDACHGHFVTQPRKTCHSVGHLSNLIACDVRHDRFVTNPVIQGQRSMINISFQVFGVTIRVFKGSS